MAICELCGEKSTLRTTVRKGIGWRLCPSCTKAMREKITWEGAPQ
jgi:ribosome-binding protein aMBF1 (putative translation factor)